MFGDKETYLQMFGYSECLGAHQSLPLKIDEINNVMLVLLFSFLSVCRNNFKAWLSTKRGGREEGGGGGGGGEDVTGGKESHVATTLPSKCSMTQYNVQMGEAWAWAWDCGWAWVYVGGWLSSEVV